MRTFLFVLAGLGVAAVAAPARAAAPAQHDITVDARGPLAFVEVTREVDNRRILWAAEDITQNRPPLSRWHPDWKDAFAAYMARR